MASVARKEIKYILNSYEFSIIRNKLSTLLEKDPNDKGQGYLVRSLYFDTVHNTSYYESVDGLLHKCKIRLRTYGDSTIIKLEMKCKEGEYSKKYSLILNQHESKMMQKGEYQFLLDKKEESSKTMYYKLVKDAYNPVTLVEYQREAYLFPAGDVRITYDSNVKATALGCDLMCENPSLIEVIPSETGVLEVKYSSVLPSFIKNIIRTNHFSTANSKYVQAREFYKLGGI